MHHVRPPTAANPFLPLHYIQPLRPRLAHQHLFHLYHEPKRGVDLFDDGELKVC
ncbi:hypothetical protein BDN72DRAFT_395716 [Pluteus cervinus]|uniref:Uncharacterized protein n=1 Tax=Pluteus cervinus TaxID=181527 RepID=A0ACD3A9K1_9AGAR|nr:hypothetical protein BDN72DRAFT_395716 [Pluteus cervinus]